MKVKHYLFLSIMAILPALSCNSPAPDQEAEGEDVFVWDVQLAGYPYDKADKKGETTYRNFINHLETFPWKDQLDKMDHVENASSPTLSVRDLQADRDLWVSVIGEAMEDGELLFLIGYIYIKETTGKRWLEMYYITDLDLMKECFKLFFDRNHVRLHTTIRDLEEYAQLEPTDLIKY